MATMIGTMSFVFGPAIGFLIPNLFLWGDEEEILKHFETSLG
jgi:hypothetical protein